MMYYIMMCIVACADAWGETLRTCFSLLFLLFSLFFLFLRWHFLRPWPILGRLATLQPTFTAIGGPSFSRLHRGSKLVRLVQNADLNRQLITTRIDVPLCPVTRPKLLGLRRRLDSPCTVPVTVAIHCHACPKLNEPMAMGKRPVTRGH